MRFSISEETLTVLNAKDEKFLLLEKADGNWSLKTANMASKITDESTIAELNRLGRNTYHCTVKDTEVSVIRFADLHRHSDCSLLDGQSKVSEIVKKTEYAGALTDHGNMYGFLEFYKGMKEAGKKPIIGFEAYTENIDGELSKNHLILLAKNQIGYQNLLHLTSESFTHFHSKPHVTWDMLRKYHEGVIATSACIAGVAQSSVRDGNLDKAEVILKEYVKIFGDDFYIEIQRHHFKEESEIMEQMALLGKKLGIKLIATTDSHYTEKEDSEAHELLLCLQTQKKINEDHWKFSGDGYFIHSSEEMEELFYDLPEALDNTLELADKCNVEVPLGKINMPNFPIPKPFATPDEYFTFLCNEGRMKRFANSEHLNDPDYLRRFQYELAMVKQMGFASYFLIVWDFINWAREHDIYVGPGRGSAAGSLLAYCIGITDLDPIKYNLLFERFLNPERISMPDIDTDFEHTRRGEIIDYVKERYGEECVCHIVTFGTMAARAVVKDVARTLNYPVSLGNKIANMMPKEPKITIKIAMQKNPDLKLAYDTDSDIKRIIDMAMRLEGCKKNVSQHACGVVVSGSKIETYLPTSMEIDPETGTKAVTSQVQGPEVEDLGLLKMDFLGLKNMTVIHDVIRNIKTTRHVDIDYHDIPLNDRATYEMLRDGNTGGVFQLESPGMTNVVTRMLSDLDDLRDDELDQCFERMIAAVALYRPGPMDFIDDYISNMKNPKSIPYDTPEIKDILSPTYGVIVFQEQVMQIVQKLAGYSLGRADVVRRAMGKKKQSVMDKEREIFIYGNQKAFNSGKDKALVPGCLKNGISKEIAIIIWEKMATFAKYAFNRPHAACYAYIAINTAYMRCHWMPEFYAAMLNAFSNSDKMKLYLVQATKAKIKIDSPDVNLSEEGFVSVNGKSIRFGLVGLKGVKGNSRKIIQERNKNGPFIDENDLFLRMMNADSKLNKPTLESLTMSGALMSFGHHKSAVMEAWPAITKQCTIIQQIEDFGQCCLFDINAYRTGVSNLKEYPEDVLMEREHEAVGFYLTKHPVDTLYEIIDEKDGYTLLPDLDEKESGSVKTVGMISETRSLYTKKDGKLMYTFVLSDRFSDIRCVVFPSKVETNRHLISDGSIVVLSGKYSAGEDSERQIIVDQLLSKDQIRAKTTQIYVVISNKEEQTKLIQFSKSHPGKTAIAIKTGDKLYKIKNTRINLNASTLDWLKQNFGEVSSL